MAFEKPEINSDPLEICGQAVGIERVCVSSVGFVLAGACSNVTVSTARTIQGGVVLSAPPEGGPSC